MYNQKNHQFDSFYNHKFGFHITGPRQDAFAEVLRLRPKVVKTLDFSVDVMRRIKQEIPDVFLIGRLFVYPQDFGQLSGGSARDAQRKGVEMAERILREEVNQDRHHYNGRPLFNAWESLNEVFPEWSADNTHKLFDEYQVAFGQKMRAAGFEPVAFNFGQGNGRGQQWLRLYPGTLETYTYLGFHEYDWPTMDRLHRLGLEGPSEPHNLVSMVGRRQGNDGMWRCLRYRRIMYEGIRQKFGDKHTAIITECGMTQGVWGGSARDVGPWAKQLTVPRTIPGGVVNTPIPPQDYWESLLWYNSELMKDDFVMGACLFVTGAAGLPEWETFEHLGVITDRIYAFQKLYDFDNLPGGEGPVPPLPPIEPDRDKLPVEKPSVPEEKPIEKEANNPPVEAEPTWRYTFETGQGLGLLVGDIGLVGERITVTLPDGRRQQVISGSKGEYGVGGFETYALQPGRYLIEFLDQKFNLTLSGQFTRVKFQKVEPVPPTLKEEIKKTEEAGKTTKELPVVEGVLSSPPLVPPVAPAQPAAPTPVVPPSIQTEWTYTFEIGQGLGLLVGDIGLPGERITIIKPDGRWVYVTSGSKGEHGIGGFELYAQQPGRYQIEFLEQRFTLTLTGQFTRVNFRRIASTSSTQKPDRDQPAAAPALAMPVQTPPPATGAAPLVAAAPSSAFKDEPSKMPAPATPSSQPSQASPPAPVAPASSPPSVPSPLASSPPAKWHYRMETGPGMGLLVGDIGIKGERIAVTRPDGRREQITSGSKPEYGLGGFELYGQQPGLYRVQFLDQTFELQLTGQFTRVIFERSKSPAQPEFAAASVPVAVSPPPEPVVEPERPEQVGLVKAVWGFIMSLFRRK